jgi:glycosyltransferase involved in cell wall biosynthesis
MKIVAVTMMRDEADIAEESVRHMLEQVDHVIVADNRSKDGTGELCDRAGAIVINDPDPAYYQAIKMTRLAQWAATTFEADWIVPFDADELWFNLSDLRAAPGNVASVRPFDYVPQREDDWNARCPFRRITHRRSHPQPLPKVAYRFHPQAHLAMGNHAVVHPVPWRAPVDLRVAHFQYRSLEQMTRKVRQGTEAVLHTNEPLTTVAHWRELAELSDAEIAKRWKQLLDETGLVLDPVVL